MKNYSKQFVIPKFFKSKHGFIRTPQKKKYNFKVYDLSDEESFYNTGVPFLFNVHKRSYAKINRCVEHTMDMSFLHQGGDISPRKRANLALTNEDETLFDERKVYSKKKSYFHNLCATKVICNHKKFKNKEKLDQIYDSPVCCKTKSCLPKKFVKENCKEDILNRFMDSHKMKGTKKPMIERFKNSKLNTCTDFTYDDFDEIIRHSNKSDDITSPINKRKILRQTSQSQSSFSFINEEYNSKRQATKVDSLCRNKGIISHGINYDDAVVPLTPKRIHSTNKLDYEELLDSFSKENIDTKEFYESPIENEVEKCTLDDRESLIDKPVDSIISLPEEKILEIYAKLLSKEGINSASILNNNESFVALPEKEISCVVSGVLNVLHACDNSDNIQNDVIRQPPNLNMTKKGDKFYSDDHFAQDASVEMNLIVQSYDPVEVLQTKDHNSQKTSEAHFDLEKGETDQTSHFILLEEPNVELLTKNVSDSQSAIILKDMSVSSKEEVKVKAKNNFGEVILASACHDDKAGKKRKNKKRKTCYGSRKKPKAWNKSPVHGKEKLMIMDTLIEGNPENVKLTQNISMDLALETESLDAGATVLTADIKCVPTITADIKCVLHSHSFASSESTVFTASPILQEQPIPQENQDIAICKDIFSSPCEISNVDLNFEGNRTTVCVTKSRKNKVTTSRRKGQKKSEMRVENNGVVEQESIENCEVNFISAETPIVIDANISTNATINSELDKNKPEGLEIIKLPDSNLDMHDSPILTERPIANDNSLDLSETNRLHTLDSNDLNIKMNYENVEDKHQKVRKLKGKAKFKSSYREKHIRKKTIDKNGKRSKVRGVCNFAQELQENKFSELSDTYNADPITVSECVQLNTNSINIKESTLLMVKSDCDETSSDFTLKHPHFPSNCQTNGQNVDQMDFVDIGDANNSFDCRIPTNFTETKEVKCRVISSSPTTDNVSTNVSDKEILSIKICKSSCSFIPMRGLVRQNPIDIKALLSNFPSDDVTFGSASTELLVVEELTVPVDPSSTLTSLQEISEINAAILKIPDSPINDFRLKSSVSKLFCLPQEVTTNSNISKIADVNQTDRNRRRVSFAGFTIVNIIDNQQDYSRRARHCKIAKEIGLQEIVTKDISSDRTKAKGILKKISKSYCLIDNNLCNDVENCNTFNAEVSPKKGLDVKSSQSIIKGILAEDIGIRAQLLRNFISQQEGYSESLFSRESPMSMQRNSMQTLYCNEGLSSGSQESELSNEGHCDDNESPISGVESLYRAWPSPTHMQASAHCMSVVLFEAIM